MCLAIPMRIVALDGLLARCEAKGVERTVSLILIGHEQVLPGDQVLVHAGYASRKITAEDARAAWELFDQILAATQPVEGDDRLNSP